MVMQPQTTPRTWRKGHDRVQRADHVANLSSLAALTPCRLQGIRSFPQCKGGKGAEGRVQKETHAC